MRISAKKKEDLIEQIETASESIGLGDRWYRTNNTIISDDYGLCSTCKNKVLIKTKYNTKLLRCDTEELKLSTEDPVIECSKYEKIGSLDLRQMVSIAYLIEVSNKIKPGFNTE